MSKELLEAASNGEIDKVKKLLDQKDVDINFVNQNGDTALAVAIVKRHENIADFLIKKNADINIQNNNGCTALHHAIPSGRLSLFELIMTKTPVLTAKAVFKENFGKTHTPLCYVFESINMILSDIQFDRFNDDLTPAMKDYIVRCSILIEILEKMVKQLIDAGSNANKISYVGVLKNRLAIRESTVSSLAMRYQSIYLATEFPGDVNEKSETANSHLQNALLHKNIPMACFLLKKGANPNQQDGFPPPFLMAVALKGSERLVQLFIEKGADVNQVARCNTTPLSKAVSAGNIQVAELLIEKGAKITDKVKELALERMSTFRLIVESTIKNRSKEMSEQAILQEFFNRILNDEIELGLDRHSRNSHIQSLMFYLLECGLEMSLTIYNYTNSDKYKHPAYDAHEQVLQLFENNNWSNQPRAYLQRDEINFVLEHTFKTLTRNGKVVCLNYRRKEDGNTWLHAAINKNPNLAAALILLGSRLDIPNYKNETVAQLIRDKPCFLILVKIKRVIDWVEERNARATNNATKIGNLLPHGISHPSTSLVDVKMEKDRPIFNQYKMSNATAATGTAGSSGAAALSDRSLPNAKEEVEEVLYIKASNETHHVKVVIKQIYDDIDKVQSGEKHYLAFLLNELIVNHPDLFDSFLDFAYKFFSEIKEPSETIVRSERRIFESLSSEFYLVNQYCFELLSAAYKHKYEFKSESQGSKLTIIPRQNTHDKVSLDTENKKLMREYQKKHMIHMMRHPQSGNSNLVEKFKHYESQYKKDLKSLQESLQDEQNHREKLQHENALLKMQIQHLQKTTQSVSPAGHKKKPSADSTIKSTACSLL